MFVCFSLVQLLNFKSNLFFPSLQVTPRVVEEVRDHFGCDQLEGAELEDQGGEGTALTHWEKRILEVR